MVNVPRTNGDAGDYCRHKFSSFMENSEQIEDSDENNFEGFLAEMKKMSAEFAKFY